MRGITEGSLINIYRGLDVESNRLVIVIPSFPPEKNQYNKNLPISLPFNDTSKTSPLRSQRALGVFLSQLCLP